ncbi:TonB-dependent receptor domain-containing protein [Microbulbifer agarilyticus]|uniref:TonB-dependent receptor domain-containing protein n=2 Tax=Microbulbifer TaxID=48073 RepID=UPI001CD2EC8B|nr:TonB-dependent receptor [Microbulbifer agarilyticus]MCA0899906.1 TonB-dependent receptor [Microbulbifer agarilyticus]
MPKTCHRSFSALLLATTLGALPAHPVVAGAVASNASSPAVTVYSFQLPAQPLEQSLLALSRETGMAVMTGVQGASLPAAPALQGRYTIDAALEFLLAGSGLRYRRVDGQGVVILPRRSEPEPSATLEEHPAEPRPLLEEVEVIASKRRTNLQHTPMAITALHGERLRERNIDSLEELAADVPSLQVTRNGDHTTSMLYLRGIGSDNHTEAGDSGIATHVDGIFSSRVQGTAVLLYDLDRVEVLRGPQGTLFGRNSTGGVINYHSARPTRDWSSEMSITLDSNQQKKWRAVANAPLTDNWALRWAAVKQTADSPLTYTSDSIAARAADRYNNTDLFSHRLSSDWQLGDALNWWVSFEGFEDRGAGSLPLVDYDTPLTIDTPGRTVLDQDTWRSRLELALPAAHTLSYIAGHGLTRRSQDWDADRESPLGSETDPAIYHQSNRTVWSKYRARQHELQLKNSDDEALRWLLAYFHFSEQNAIRFDLEHQLEDGSGWGGAPSHSFQQPHRGTRLNAVYGQLDYDVSEYWQASVGARTGRDQRYDRGGRNIACPDLIRADRGGELGVIAVNQASANPGQCFVANYNDVDRAWRSTTAMARLSYQPADETLLYLLFAEGFKPGIVQDGASLSGTYSGAEDPAFQQDLTLLIARNNDGAAYVGPETSTNIEMGFKLGLLDGAMTLNGALFDTGYRDLQVSGIAVAKDGTELIRSTNAPSATIRGLELELNWASSQNGRVSGFLSWLDARYNRFYAVDNEFPDHGATWNPSVGDPQVPNLVDFSGNRLKQVPRLSLGLNYRHGFPVGDALRATARLGLHYTSSMYFDEANRGDRSGFLWHNSTAEWVPDPSGAARNIDRRPTHSLWNAGIKLAPHAGNWWLDLYGDNLTNALVASDVHDADVAVPAYYYGPPRSVGLRFGLQFD